MPPPLETLVELAELVALVEPVELEALVEPVELVALVEPVELVALVELAALEALVEPVELDELAELAAPPPPLVVAALLLALVTATDEVPIPPPLAAEALLLELVSAAAPEPSVVLVPDVVPPRLPLAHAGAEQTIATRERGRKIRFDRKVILVALSARHLRQAVGLYANADSEAIDSDRCHRDVTVTRGAPPEPRGLRHSTAESCQVAPQGRIEERARHQGRPRGRKQFGRLSYRDRLLLRLDRAVRRQDRDGRGNPGETRQGDLRVVGEEVEAHLVLRVLAERDQFVGRVLPGAGGPEHVAELDVSVDLVEALVVEIERRRVLDHRGLEVANALCRHGRAQLVHVRRRPEHVDVGPLREEVIALLLDLTVRGDGDCDRAGCHHVGVVLAKLVGRA
jgi:hypothetical protein